MRSRRLFIGCLGAAFLLHALILFIPISSTARAPVDFFRVSMKPIPPRLQDHSVKTVEETSKPERENTEVLERARQENLPPASDNMEEQDDTSESAQVVNSTIPGIADKTQPAISLNAQLLPELRERLKKSLRYPEVARRKGMQGAVAVSLTLDIEGNAQDLYVSESSGSRILDRAALRAISDIFPYPNPPSEAMSLTIPVIFRLNE